MALISIDPATGNALRRYEELSADRAVRRIEASQSAFERWRNGDIAQRAEHMNQLAECLRKQQEPLSALMTAEMGKPIRDSRGEIEKCAWVCEHYARHAENMLAPETIATDATKSYVSFEPLGVLLGVMPWNYPFWQVFRFAVPAVMAGNAVLLKHASNVCGCSLAIQQLFETARFPGDLFQSLLITSKGVETVLDHPNVRGVSLTGSSDAGRAVASAAGNRIKKVVLELGGSDPYVILEDAPLPESVASCVKSRLLNSGQSCIAAKRFIVVRPVQKAFEKALVSAMLKVKTGDPTDESVEIGPQARGDLRDTLHRQVQQSIESGARCLIGGQIPEGPGYYYPPTVLTDVTEGMPVFDEETFGPVAAVITAGEEKEALRLANQTSFGLGAAVFTADIQRGERIARKELQAGSCFVNDFVRSDPRLPFGGIRDSGVGRELSHYGIREFVNVKTVYVK